MLDILFKNPDWIEWPILIKNSDMIIGFNINKYEKLLNPMNFINSEQLLLDYAQRLISYPSITPDNTKAQAFLMEVLEPLGFVGNVICQNDVKNFWLQYGSKKPLFVFAGHTDVVPPGDTQQWRIAPFLPAIEEGKLYGRGAADMKGGIACMMAAVVDFLHKYDKNKIQGSIAFLITGDEEGPAIDGTKKVVEWLRKKNISIDYTLVGEPTSEKKMGDTIKYGRRGSLTAHITLLGKQGHIAYPQFANNPSILLQRFLDGLSRLEWDKGNAHFDPTGCQIFSIETSTHISNVVPASIKVSLNWRYSSQLTSADIQERTHNLLDKLNINYEIDWKESAQPFLSKQGNFSKNASDIIQEVCGIKPNFSTTGGTSDARFLHSISNEILEIGVKNTTIHQINECVDVDDLKKLHQIYFRLLEKLLL